MTPEVEAPLEKRARLIAWHFAKDLPAPKSANQNDFRHMGSVDDAWHKIEHPELGSVRFWPNEHCYVQLFDVAPKDVSREKLHKPQTTGTNKLDVSTSVIENASDAILEETYAYERSKTKTFNENLGVAVEVGITQKIAYGGAASPVSGETGLSLNINTSYGKEWGGSESETQTASRTIAVPPHTKLTVSQQLFKGAFSQRCEYWCDLTHGVRVWSRDDFDHKYNTFDEFLTTAMGNAPDKFPAGKHFRARPVNRGVLDKIKKPVEIYYDKLITFNEATNGDIKVTSEEIVNA